MNEKLKIGVQTTIVFVRPAFLFERKTSIQGILEATEERGLTLRIDNENAYVFVPWNAFTGGGWVAQTFE